MHYVRPPAVAGMFYERDPDRLRQQVAGCLGEPVSERSSFTGVVAPHAGLMYSGNVAGALYKRLALPKRLIILCPNHTGAGSAASINVRGAWRTPLGEAVIDELLAAELMREAPMLQDDVRAHAREHSLEVQLPFLQLLTEFTFVPICLALPSIDHARELGSAIARVVQRSGGEVGIIASSDLNHYEDQQTTLRKDQRVIDAVLALAPESLWQRVRAEEISMCGFIPTTTMLFAARELGATETELVMHATSGDVNGDYDAVVGYASIIVRRPASAA